jgi:acetyltransferase-like isoleucine patch superfamily enzyme
VKRYFSFKLWFNYLGRKLRVIWKKLILFGQAVSIHESSNVALSCRIEPWTGSVVIGARTLLDYGVVIRAYGGNITLGEDCTIGPYSVLYGGGDIEIGEGTRIGPHVSLIAGNHCFDDLDKFIFLQGMTFKGIQIGADVWIGTGVKILDGVSIGSGAVIGAGSVVVHDVGDYEVVGGVPSRLLRMRGIKNTSVVS